jgi:hypothetical protein
MDDRTAVGTRIQQFGHQLDELAARATRVVAELRKQSQLALDDLAHWQQQLDFSRVDAEIARMDARDELRRAAALVDERRIDLNRRLDEARTDATDALRTLRDGFDSTLHDVARALGVVYGDTK